MNDSETDRRLVTRYLETRAEAAFRRLYRRHTPALYALALRLLAGRAADAQDAVQESWVRACRSLPDFRWSSSLRTWLCGITINCAREQLRRASRPAAPELAPGPAAGGGPRRGPDRVDWERAIAALPDGYRQVLVLFDVAGYSHEEVGRLLGISTGTSKSQLSRAREALRRRLSPAGGGV